MGLLSYESYQPLEGITVIGATVALSEYIGEALPVLEKHDYAGVAPGVGALEVGRLARVASGIIE